MHYYFYIESCEIICREHEDKSDPNPHFTTIQELIDSPVSTAAMLAWVNSDKPADKKLKGFRTRAEGAARVFKELGHMTDEELMSEQNETDTTLEPEKKPKGRKKAQPSTHGCDDSSAHTESLQEGSKGAAGRGRKSEYSGKLLFHTLTENQEGVIINPRKVGSHGYRSMEILINAGSEGITYEDYISKGGRPQDLRWDINHGHARVA